MTRRKSLSSSPFSGLKSDKENTDNMCVKKWRRCIKKINVIAQSLDSQIKEQQQMLDQAQETQAHQHSELAGALKELGQSVAMLATDCESERKANAEQ